MHIYECPYVGMPITLLQFLLLNDKIVGVDRTVNVEELIVAYAAHQPLNVTPVCFFYFIISPRPAIYIKLRPNSGAFHRIEHVERTDTCSSVMGLRNPLFAGQTLLR